MTVTVDIKDGGKGVGSSLFCPTVERIGHEALIWAIRHGRCNEHIEERDGEIPDGVGFSLQIDTVIIDDGGDFVRRCGTHTEKQRRKARIFAQVDKVWIFLCVFCVVETVIDGTMKRLKCFFGLFLQCEGASQIVIEVFFIKADLESRLAEGLHLGIPFFFMGPFQFVLDPQILFGVFWRVKNRFFLGEKAEKRGEEKAEKQRFHARNPLFGKRRKIGEKRLHRDMGKLNPFEARCPAGQDFHCVFRDPEKFGEKSDQFEVRFPVDRRGLNPHPDPIGVDAGDFSFCCPGGCFDGEDDALFRCLIPSHSDFPD